MNLNVNILLFSVLLTSSIYSMEQNKIEIDETPAKINAEALQAAKRCQNQCSFLEDIASREEYAMKCIEDDAQQQIYYLVRKYTSLCAGKLFSEEWRCKTDDREKLEDMLATADAYDLWENGDIRSCAQECLAQCHKNNQFVERNVKKALVERPKNNPGLTKFMDLVNRFRGRK